MSTSKKKVSIVFNVLLFAAILLIPATAFNANAQEEYKEKKDAYGMLDNNDYQKEYQYNKDSYSNYNEKDIKKSYDEKDDYYKPHKEKKNNQVTIKKELFICDDVLNVINNNNNNNNDDNGINGLNIESFDCLIEFDAPFFISEQAVSPDSGQYIACNDEVCPGIDESTFSVNVFKDVAFEQDLTSQGNTINPNEFHYVVAEDELDDRNGLESPQQCGGFFTDSMRYNTMTETAFIEYNICILYEGDCQGTIYPGEEKTCTVKNYIVAGEIDEIVTKLTVNKNLYSCHNINDTGEFANCGELVTEGGPDANGWELCDDIPSSFCANNFEENDFTIVVLDEEEEPIDPPGEFQGSTEGEMFTEPGIYEVQEIKSEGGDFQLVEDEETSMFCSDNGFDDGGTFTIFPENIVTVCFEYEDEIGGACSPDNPVNLEEGNNKVCTVKNYIVSSVFEGPE